MPRLLILLGPPGSGKSTLAQKYINEHFIYVNQDKQGKDRLTVFHGALMDGRDIVTDITNSDSH